MGSGFYGLTVARLAAESGLRVEIIEKRSHIGGNSWSEVDPATGIEFHKYGTHLFHTNNERVWKFVNRFAEFNEYKHRVFTSHEGRLYEMPPTLQEISWFYPGSTSPESAQSAVAQDANLYPGQQPDDNFETKAISLVGKKIYESLIRGYTEKQWQTDPKELPSSVISRLPFHLSFGQGYFKDKYQGIPKLGYGNLLLSLAQHPNITVRKNEDFFHLPSQVNDQRTLTVFTGPIDRFFHYQHGHLGWRTLDFEYQTVETRDFQGTSVMNYADPSPTYTRIHEFKHLHPERTDVFSSDKTLIAMEYSRLAFAEDEPFYPINSPDDKAKLLLYKQMAEKIPEVHFGGRLGSYKYLDMHMAIGAAISDWENVLKARLGINSWTI